MHGGRKIGNWKIENGNAAPRQSMTCQLVFDQKSRFPPTGLGSRAPHRALVTRCGFRMTMARGEAIESCRSKRLLDWESAMSTFGLIEYKDASPEVRAIYDDILATRKTDWINNFWKAIAHDPALLKRTLQRIKQLMA